MFQVHAFVRDADDAIEWIQEKDLWVSSNDYGHDLESVRALIAKHEGFEQDLAAISEQVGTHVQSVSRIQIKFTVYPSTLYVKSRTYGLS